MKIVDARNVRILSHAIAAMRHYEHLLKKEGKDYPFGKDSRRALCDLLEGLQIEPRATFCPRCHWNQLQENEILCKTCMAGD